MRRDLPSGTVTFLFTDVEGSTKLLQELSAAGYAEALAEHRQIVRDALSRHGGIEIDTQGDAFFAAFPTAPGALGGAVEILAGLARGPLRVRIGLHTGTARVAEEGYVGVDVHRAARIAACGHGGQVLLSAATAALVGSEGLRDLGEHRLKDLSAPERIYQLGESAFPPLKSLNQTNLPIPSTPFLGREHELTQVRTLLSQQEVRLLTLTGPGGTGKTRIALQAAAGLADRYGHGVWWVPLAPLRDPELVLATAGQVLGAKASLAAHIADKSMLLLLDNFEQVVEASADTAALLGSCPNLDLLVTSREPLHLSGEHEFPVPPLTQEEGVGFFLSRARAVKPDLQLDDAIPEICRRLDDLPLALELAAARVKVLSTRHILERLGERLPLLTGGARDVPERQRTLRAAIEWSYELLEPQEQRLFGRLAAFRGGCTLESAEEVAEGDLDTLQSLVDKSLIRHTADRFWMLETIHEYAAERLRETAEEASIRNQHLDHFLRLAERAYEDRILSESTWFPVMDREHHNTRAALDWAQLNQPRAAAQLIGAVAWYWDSGGYGPEALERLTSVLARYRQPDTVRARALTHFGEIADPGPEVLSQLDEALGIWREHGDARGEALALEVIGYARAALGEHRPAQLALEQGLALLRQVGAPEIEAAGSLLGLCRLLASSGEIERLEPLAQQLHELGMRHDDRWTVQMALHYLADCPLIAGDYVSSESRYLRALAHARESGLHVQCPPELIGVAMSAAGQGDAARAVRLAAAANAQREAFGYTKPSGILWWRRMQERHIGDARAQLGPGTAEEIERSGRETPFEALLDEVLGTKATRS